MNNQTNTMKKLKPNKDTLLQYIFDYGIEKTCKLLHITEEEINSVLYPSKQDYGQHKFIYNVTQTNPSIAKVIADNYNYLKAKFVGNTTHLQLSLTDEDIFHNTLLKVISENIEGDI